MFRQDHPDAAGMAARPRESMERAIDDTRFAMAMTIRHPLFGMLYGYSGTFRIGETRLDG